MHELRLSRALAERCLDAVDGRLRVAIERFGTGGVPFYELYPATPGWPDLERLLSDLAGLEERLQRARAAARKVDRRGDRVAAAPDAWTASQHAAHLLEFERDAVLPRIVALLSDEAPVWIEWEPHGPLDVEPEFEAVVRELGLRRAETVATLRDAPPGILERRARLGSESPTLYQFLRGVRQHDEAHASRIEERVHPELLGTEVE